MTSSLRVSIHQCGVVGAGAMGHGIAHTLLRHGYAVNLYDASAKALEAAKGTIAKGLGRDAEKGRLAPDEREKALARLTLASNPESLARSDIIVEAVTENFEVKAGVFRALDKICGNNVIFASNTSSISITRLAAVTGRANRFVGLHFFNPVPVMKLVEVVAGLETSPETVETVVALAQSLAKTPVRAQDFPGFVSNRVLMPMINEAVFCVMEGVAGPQAVDDVMKLGMNHPMGPLELADFIGLDVCLDIMRALYDGFRDSKYRPCPLLEKMVNAGRLGKKSGCGFHDYSSSAAAH
ncbi:MAG: 3-hydroxyacyl-CoA dehydrogenase family protein [Terriglobia bacterium]